MLISEIAPMGCQYGPQEGSGRDCPSLGSELKKVAWRTAVRSWGRGREKREP